MAVVATEYRGHSDALLVDDLIVIIPTDRQGIVMRHAVDGGVITLAAGRDMAITQIAFDALVSSHGATLAPAVSRAQQMINDGEIS